jgi:hypothetical protein
VISMTPGDLTAASAMPSSENTGALLTGDAPRGATVIDWNERDLEVARPRSWSGRLCGGVALILRKTYELFCLIILLALVSMIPILQVIAFGYLLDLSGRVAKTGRLRDGPAHLAEAAKLVTALASLHLFCLPALLFGSWAQAAELISSGSESVHRMERIAVIFAAFAFFYLLWAWSRGGRLRDYLWPSPRRFLAVGWRLGYWREAYASFWAMLDHLEIPRLFWLGLRGLIGTGLWLGVPAILLITTARQGQSGLAGVVGFLGALTMGWVLIYLPFLQTRFAVENRWRSLFEVQHVRSAFRSAPAMFWLALVITFWLAVPPYIFKIEAVPREIAWLPAAIVVAFVLPGRLITGWAMYRGTHRAARRGWGWTLWQGSFRLAMPPVIIGYLFVIYATQFTSWHGLATWFQQHAVTVPVPFAGT